MLESLSREIRWRWQLGGQLNLPTKISARSKAFSQVPTLLLNASERQWSSNADRTAAPIAGALIKFATDRPANSKSHLLRRPAPSR
jgi:hypothetical protein